MFFFMCCIYSADTPDILLVNQDHFRDHLGGRHWWHRASDGPVWLHWLLKMRNLSLTITAPWLPPIVVIDHFALCETFFGISLHVKPFFLHSCHGTSLPGHSVDSCRNIFSFLSFFGSPNTTTDLLVIIFYFQVPRCNSGTCIAVVGRQFMLMIEFHRRALTQVQVTFIKLTWAIDNKFVHLRGFTDLEHSHLCGVDYYQLASLKSQPWKYPQYW